MQRHRYRLIFAAFYFTFISFIKSFNGLYEPPLSVLNFTFMIYILLAHALWKKNTRR